MLKPGFELAISDGMYPGLIAGLVKHTAMYQDKPKTAYFFILQLRDDNNEVTYIRSKDFTLSFSEKSNFFKYLAGWTKIGTPDDLVKSFETNNVIKDGNFDVLRLFGKDVLLTINLKASKKDAEKSYPEVLSFAPCSVKSGKYGPVDTTAEIPFYFTVTADEYTILEGLKIQETPAGYTGPRGPQSPTGTAPETPTAPETSKKPTETKKETMPPVQTPPPDSDLPF